MIDAERPESAASPVGAKGRKQARHRSRPRNKQKAPVKVTNGSGKFSPERARVVLDSLSERPIQSDAAEKAGIHRKTLENWIKHSKAGDAGYDIEHEGVTMRFHVHCEWSKDAAYDKILEAAYLIAMGKAYVTDENGNVTLETVRPDPHRGQPAMLVGDSLTCSRTFLVQRLTPRPHQKYLSHVLHAQQMQTNRRISRYA
jgi:hypothetical protein